MPRYRVTIWSASNPTIRSTKIVVKRSVLDAARYATRRAAGLYLGSSRGDDDAHWKVERQDGHLNGWVVARHSRDRGAARNG